MGLTVDSSQLTILPSSKSLDTITTTNVKNLAQSNWDIVLSLHTNGQLSAPIVNGKGDSCWKLLDLQLWRACDLDLGSGHTAYRRASLIDLNITKIEPTFFGRTYVLTDGWTLGRRSTLNSRPKNQSHIWSPLTTSDLEIEQNYS